MSVWPLSRRMDIWTLLAAHIAEFLAELPVIRDGRPEGVHNARVASRRLRELLPLVSETARMAQAESLITNATRQLGTVRDLDVMIGLLDRKAAMVPAAALAVAAARRTLTGRRTLEQRALIKALEHLDLDRLAVPSHPRRALALPTGPFRWRAPWERTLRDRVGRRAEQLHDAIAHATGVYFPNRLHSVRIAVKKLRYAVEAAAHLGAWHRPRLLKDLRRIQAGLGDLHDAEILRQRVGTLIDADVPAHETTALIAALGADIGLLHESYLGRRDRLHLIADVCGRDAAPRVRFRGVHVLRTAS
jgi:CHAD domain-containing protein